MKSKAGRSSEEGIHDIIGIRSEADKEEKFGTLFDGAYDTFDGWVIIEPSGNRVAKERTGDYEYKESA